MIVELFLTAAVTALHLVVVPWSPWSKPLVFDMEAATESVGNMDFLCFLELVNSPPWSV